MKTVLVILCVVFFVGCVAFGLLYVRASVVTGEEYQRESDEDYVQGLVDVPQVAQDEEEVSLPGTITLARLQDSKVVHDLRIDITAVLRGKVVDVSVPDRMIVLQVADDDPLTIYFKENAIMPVPWQEDQKLKMESIKKGEEATVIVKLVEEVLEGTTFFEGYMGVKLK